MEGGSYGEGLSTGMNDSLPPGKKWSMRAIAKEVEVPKTTIIERLSQRRKGKGHIAGASGNHVF